ncbi:hypothetical protein BGZ73_003712 [Actinomortierella ambigua]|nr:hypothetical protein BGZ73_003712 [Actinomortierella ambigua]
MASEVASVPPDPAPATVVVDTGNQENDDHLIIKDAIIRRTLEELLRSFDPLLNIEHADLEDVELEPLNLEEGIFGRAIENPEHPLQRDKAIINDAKYYSISLSEWITDKDVDSMSVAEFTLRESTFHHWMSDHASVIGTTAVFQSRYCSQKTGLIRYTYYCQCHGQPQQRKDRKKEGVSGKPRNTLKASVKCGCLSSIIAQQEAKGSLERAVVVTYNYQHNHSLAILKDIGTAQQSARIKVTIKSLLEQGSSVTKGMRRLTMNYDRFIAVVRRNDMRLSSDDFITYEDVYKIWYTIQVEKMPKDRVPKLTFLTEDRRGIEKDLDIMAPSPPDTPVEQEQQPFDTTAALDLRYLIDRIYALESLRDTTKPLPQAAELCSLLSQFLHLYEPSFPRKEGEDLSKKRARQLY